MSDGLAKKIFGLGEELSNPDSKLIEFDGY